MSGSFSGAGLLFVTGRLTFAGTASWNGTMLLVGKGEFKRSGSGGGTIIGAQLLANVAGADRAMWTSDDCDGPDGVSGNADDGIGPGYYDCSGGGTGLTGYCGGSIDTVQQEFPFQVRAFRQM